MINFNEKQTEFIRKAQKRLNANQPDGQKLTELDVIRKIMEAGHDPFSSYINSLPKKTVKHLKVWK